MTMNKCDDCMMLKIEKARKEAYREGYVRAYRTVYEMAYIDTVESVERMISHNLDVQLISEIADMPVEKVEELKKRFKK